MAERGTRIGVGSVRFTLALVALCATTFWFVHKDSSQSDNTERTASPIKPRNTDGDGDGTRLLAAKPLHLNAVADSSADQTLPMGSSDLSAESTSETHASSVLERTSAGSNPNSAGIVERHFKISPSVDAQCAIKPIPSPEECKKVGDLIAEMSREERDSIWAPSVEAKLRSLVTTSLEDVKIRSLECRTSLCAIEVASSAGHLNIFGESEQRMLGLYDNGRFVLGWETSSSGVRETITVRVFERRVQ